MQKAMIWISVFVVSTLGSWVGELIGHSWLSLWSIGLGTIGAFVGVWVGWRLGNA